MSESDIDFCTKDDITADDILKHINSNAAMFVPKKPEPPSNTFNLAEYKKAQLRQQFLETSNQLNPTNSRIKDLVRCKNNAANKFDSFEVVDFICNKELHRGRKYNFSLQKKTSEDEGRSLETSFVQKRRAEIRDSKQQILNNIHESLMSTIQEKRKALGQSTNDFNWKNKPCKSFLQYKKNRNYISRQNHSNDRTNDLNASIEIQNSIDLSPSQKVRAEIKSLLKTNEEIFTAKNTRVLDGSPQSTTQRKNTKTLLTKSPLAGPTETDFVNTSQTTNRPPTVLFKPQNLKQIMMTPIGHSLTVESNDITHLDLGESPIKSKYDNTLQGFRHLQSRQNFATKTVLANKDRYSNSKLRKSLDLNRTNESQTTKNEGQSKVWDQVIVKIEANQPFKQNTRYNKTLNFEQDFAQAYRSDTNASAHISKQDTKDYSSTSILKKAQMNVKKNAQSSFQNSYQTFILGRESSPSKSIDSHYRWSSAMNYDSIDSKQSGSPDASIERQRCQDIISSSLEIKKELKRSNKSLKKIVRTYSNKQRKIENTFKDFQKIDGVRPEMLQIMYYYNKETRLNDRDERSTILKEYRTRKEDNSGLSDEMELRLTRAKMKRILLQKKAIKCGA